MISNLASISSETIIGADVKIGPFTTIHEDVKIGARTIIHSNVSIYPGTRIGEDCEIFPGAVIGVIPQDLKFDGEYTTVEIGNNTTIRECVTIHIGNNVILASYVGLSGHVTIDDFAILEGTVVAQQFVHIGAHAFVGGASLIRKDVPPYIKAAREPLTYAGVNSVGIRRRGFSDDQVREIEDIYRILYVQNNNVSKGIASILETIPDSDIRKHILGFIDTSDKGIIRGLN